MPSIWPRLLSYVWPVTVWRGKGAHGELELTWEYGRLVVNSANANQSFGSSHRVWRQAFRDTNIVARAPANALILGYGAGSVASILRGELGMDLPITGVDDDEAMLRLAQERFHTVEENRIKLVREDAFHFAAEHPNAYDLVVVDLFQDLDFAQGVENRPFLEGVRRLTRPDGLVLINMVAHDDLTTSRGARLGRELRLLFTEVQEQRYEGNNRVFIAL